MGTIWIIVGVAVGIAASLGAGLMTMADTSAHIGACLAFLLSGIALIGTGAAWWWRHPERDWTVHMRAIGLTAAVLITTPIMMWFAWPIASAQTIGAPPSVSGNCNNFGNNNTNCNTFNLGPPHDPSKLYLLNGATAGDVIGIHPLTDQTSVTFDQIIVPDGFPWGVPVQIQNAKIACNKPDSTTTHIEGMGAPVNKYWAVTCKRPGPA